MNSQSVRIVNLVLSVILLVLAACAGGSGKPTVTDTETKSPTATESPRKETPPTTETPRAGGAPSTPIIVRLHMPKAPRLNEEVEVALEIQAYRDAPGTTAQIELPQSARLVKGDLTWEGEVKVGSPVRLAATIAFTQEGEYTIRGVALRRVNADTTWGDAAYIYLTIKSGASSFGFESGSNPEMNAGPAPTKTP